MWCGACRWAGVGAVSGGARTSQLLLVGRQVAAAWRRGQGRVRGAGSGWGQSPGAVARTWSRPPSCRDLRTLFGNKVWPMVSAGHGVGEGEGVHGDWGSGEGVTMSWGGGAQCSFAGKGCPEGGR